MSIRPVPLVNVENVCFDLQIIKNISKKISLTVASELKYKHRSKMLVKRFLKNIFRGSEIG